VGTGVGIMVGTTVVTMVRMEATMVGVITHMGDYRDGDIGMAFSGMGLYRLALLCIWR